MPYRLILDLFNRNSDLDDKIPLERARYLVKARFKIKACYVTSILIEMRDMNLICFEKRRWIKILSNEKDFEIF